MSSVNTKVLAALSVATVKSAVAPLIFLPFVQRLNYWYRKYLHNQLNEISSPMVGDPGRVNVMAPEVVFIKYPAPAAPVTGESPVTLTACHEVPPASNSVP